MTKPEWGTKRTCANCGTRFYDMKKKPPVCPKCDTVFEVKTSPKSRRAKQAAVEEEEKKKPTPENIDDIEVTADGDEESVIEDVDELDDDMDVGVVVEIDDEDMNAR